MRRIVIAALTVCVLPTYSTAQEPPATEAPTARDWTLDGDTLRRGDSTVALPCEGTSLATSPDALYVTCATGGLLLLERTTNGPRAVEIRRLLEAVPATAVRAVGDDIWVDTPLGSRPLDAFDQPSPAPVAVPPRSVGGELTTDEPEPPQPPANTAEPKDEETGPPAAGRVVELGNGFVVVDVGASAGLIEEAWIEFFRVEQVDLGAGEVVERERRLGLGQVDTVSGKRARIELGLNERIPLGSGARLLIDESVNPRGRRITPPRPHNVWEITLNTRPFLALQTLGGGAIIDGSVGYRLGIPMAIDLFVHPFAFGVARDGDILSFAGNAVVSYDTTAFQIGLGAGASRINTLRAGGGTDYLPEGEEEPSFRVGLSAAQFVRLGSVDGLHVSVLNNFILFEDEFVFGGITLDGAVPIILFREPAWIRARGGGGVPGHIFAELGIRILARGNGGPGSVFLTPTVGGGVLTGERWETCERYPDQPYIPVDERDAPELGDPEPGICRSQYSYGGPLVGFGVEWRL